MPKVNLFVYHQVPSKMKRKILYPLNVIQKIFPEIYQKEAEKYRGRTSLMKMKIPVLGCLWNDVIHLSAVNPKEIKKELAKNKIKFEHTPYAFAIDFKALYASKTIIFKNRRNRTKILLKDVEIFNGANLLKNSRLTEQTKKYYKKQTDRGRRPLAYYGVAHVFYKGMISINKIKIIKV